MKSIAVLYAGDCNGHQFEKVFDNKSAFDLCLNWAQSLSENIKTVVLADEKIASKVNEAADSNIKVVINKNWTNGLVVSAIADETAGAGADYALFTWGDCPFINKKITEEVIFNHTQYKAEYTFADGFAYGLTPEAVDKGAASIIAALAADSQKNAGDKPVSRDCLFSIMNGDINSFEIETVLADKDYRMLRYEFECSTKSGLNSCLKLFNAADKRIADCDYDIYKISDLAESLPEIQQTLPGYYSIQITEKYGTESIYSPYGKIFGTKSLPDMSFENFKALVKKIAGFSEKAVVGLSLFGEPLLHSRFVDFAREVLSYPGLSLFVETDGLSVTEDIASAVACVNDSTDATGRVDWCVKIDGTDSAMYQKMNGGKEGDFEKAFAAVGILEKYFENRVYPQFTRMNANEEQLEGFFRFWKEKESPSKGQLLVMKYNNYAGLLSDEKPADLSPLERNACWHLRRDMNILSDGTVIFCPARADETAGNVFTDSLEEIWNKITPEVQKHINKDYCAKCKACDEYYTFNF